MKIKVLVIFLLLFGCSSSKKGQFWDNDIKPKQQWCSREGICVLPSHTINSLIKRKHKKYLTKQEYKYLKECKGSWVIVNIILSQNRVYKSTCHFFSCGVEKAEDKSTNIERKVEKLIEENMKIIGKAPYMPDIFTPSGKDTINFHFNVDIF